MTGKVVEFRKPTDADIEYVCLNMRQEDRREIRRFTGDDPAYALRHSIAMSDSCYAGVTERGEVLAIFGIGRINLLEGTAIVWSLSTTAVEKNRLLFFRSSKAAFEMLGREFPDVSIVYNYIDTEYTRAVHWLEHLGFSPSLSPLRKGARGGKFIELYSFNPFHKED